MMPTTKHAIAETEPEQTSAFFFHGALAPQEFANFNVQNVQLSDGGVIEVFGHAIAVWWPSMPRSRVDDLRDDATLWVRLFAASYYLEAGFELDVELRGWVEALDVRANEAVVGIIDPRFHRVDVVEEGDPVNKKVRAAIVRAEQLRGKRHFERAALELWEAACDPTDQAFLSAFRALESIRRSYEDASVSDSVKREREAWDRMKADLGVTEPMLSVIDTLREAAKAVRHGDRPTHGSETHVANKARSLRTAILESVLLLVKEAVGKS